MKEAKYLVSVVVPIYNVEKYLTNCIESLLNQTEKNIEIVLVDDGSPDNSGKIADQYAKMYSNIKVIHQSNSGLGPARNTGIINSNGIYVGFVDSDDWVDKQMYKNLVTKALDSKADIVFGGHKDIINGKIARIKPHLLASNTLNNKEDILKIRKNLFGHAINDKEVEAYPMRVWTGIYKRSFLLENNLKFENILSEDTIFNLEAYKKATIISFIDSTDYCYRQDNQPSIMKSFSKEKINQYIKFLVRLNDIANNEDNDALLRVKRTAIDYERLYIGIVSDSGLPFKEKKREISNYTENKIIKDIWKNYPINALPFKQRIFHLMIIKKYYNMVLFLIAIRQILKRKGH